MSRVAVLEALPAAQRPLVKTLLRLADERDVAVHLVGGPVRDHLLGRPIRDVDLMVERRGRTGAPQLARAVRGGGVRAVSHERFGTARLEGPAGVVDLATARRESYRHPGALPRVAPGSLVDDLRRRDFSVNALAIPLSRRARREHPAVVDPLGGRADLAARRLRILHPRSFHDDPTRALRAARLGPRLGFRLDAVSRRALAAALREGVLARVSGERLRRELEKVFADVELGLDPVRALDAAGRWGVLRALHPVLEGAGGARGELRRLRRSLLVPPWSVRDARAWVPGFALWLAPVRAGARREVLERLAVQGALRERLEAFPAWRGRLARVLARAGRGAVDRRLAGLGDEWLLALHASTSPAARRRIARWAREDRDRAALLSGDALVELGLSGRAVGRALARLRAAQLDGELRTSDEARAWARRLVARRRA